MLLRQARLWVFGYDMDNMKPRGWYSVEMPLVAVPAAQQARLREWVIEFVDLARQAAWTVRTQIKTAWFKRPKDVKGDMSDIDQQFYEATQPAFFRALRLMGDALANADDDPHVPTAIALAWHRRLRQHSLALFDAKALSGPLAEMDMKRLIRARQYLLYWWSPNGKRGAPVTKFARWGGFDKPDETRNQKETVDE